MWLNWVHVKGFPLVGKRWVGLVSRLTLYYRLYEEAIIIAITYGVKKVC